MKRSRALSAYRDFRLLWIGQGLSAFGASITGVAAPLIALEVTKSPTLVGVVSLCETLPFLVFQLHVGAYVDRWSRRAVMLVADGARGVAAISIVVALSLGCLTFVQIAIVAVVDGLGFLLFMTAEAAVVPVIVSDPDDMPSAIATNQARSYGSQLLGRPLGGLLYGIARSVPFVADACSYVVSMLSTAAIKTSLTAPSVERRSGGVLSEIKEGLQIAWANRLLRVMALLTIGTDFVINGLFLMTVIVARLNGASAFSIGVMSGLGSLGGLLGAAAAPVITRSRFSLRAVVIAVFWSGVPLVALMATTKNPIALGVLLGLVLFAWPTFNAVVVARWMTQIPNHQMGRVQAAGGVIGWAPVPFAPLVGSFLIQQFGSVTAMISFAAVVLVVAILATVNRTIKSESALASATGHTSAPGAGTPAGTV